VERPARRVRGQTFQRYVVQTHVIRPGEILERTVLAYVKNRVGPTDILVLGEKIVAIAEKRAVPLESIKPGLLARLLAPKVKPLGYGLGLRRVETMEVAIREVGSMRIVAAACAGAIDRLMNRSGSFYRVAGRRVAAIDGPGPTTIPPYDRYVVLGPKDPESLCQHLSRRLQCRVAVVDVNDVGSEMLAGSSGTDRALVEDLMRDNPMGQGSQGTPIAVLRPCSAPAAPPPWPSVGVWPQGGWMTPGAGVGDAGLHVHSWYGGQPSHERSMVDL